MEYNTGVKSGVSVKMIVRHEDWIDHDGLFN